MPEFYNPYNNVEIMDITPTLTANYDRITNSATVLVFENELKERDKLTNIKREVPKQKPFTYVSLFSGIGGFEQALNKLGGTCVFASEIDKFAAQAYETLYGEKPAGDITKVDARDIPDHDLLVGGFPCQAFSVAGKRKGLEDARGTLFFDIARIAAEKKPKALLLENVKGLVNHDKGRTLDVMIETLNEIGYVVDFDVLNSKHFGVPQNRERIFIVAIREDLIEAESLSEESTTGNTIVPKGKRRIGEWAKTFNFDWPKQLEVTTRLRDILELTVDEKYYLDEEKTAKLVAQLNEGSGIGKDGELGTLVNGVNISPTIDASYAKGLGPSDVAKNRNRRPMYTEPQMLRPVQYNRKDGLGKELDQANTLSASDWRGLNRNQNQNAVLEEIRPVLTPDRMEKRQNGRRFKEDGEESFTLTSQDRHGVALGNPPKYRIRKLTPRECWRLQGFPDEAHDAVESAGISDSQRYKQAGNAVTVNVIEAIAERLIPLIEI